MSPLVSVIVLNYRSPQAAVRCVLHLLEQSIAGQIEVIVVDNHSQDDSVGVLRNRLGHLSAVRIVETPRNVGFGGGCNLGARFARGEFLLINNPDKLLQRDGIETLLRRMREDKRIGIIGPKLLYSDGSVRPSARAFPSPLDVIAKRSFLSVLLPGRMARYLQNGAEDEPERRVDWVVGGCFLISKDLFFSLGGFDESFFLFFEDTDLCRRVIQTGRSVIYYPRVAAADRIARLSEGGILTLLCTPTGRAHVRSALHYFAKWGVGVPQMSA
ncbi:glycosyltransferase family 2 protein [Candidatus Peregrinibacteria bacterium]|nr:glycosyltransferase family 2 protein [Candidatus Peregrinibacteria bacterium]